MKQLSKEELTDLVFNKCQEIAIKNSEEFGKRMLNLADEKKDHGVEMIVEYITAYGNEMRKECCQTIAEVLYDVLYDEENKHL